MYPTHQSNTRVRARMAIMIHILFWSFSFASFAQSEQKNGVNVGLGYPITSHGVRAREYANVFSMNATVGVSREENGLAMAGLSHFVKENAKGLQMAGFSNHIGQAAQGVTMAGFANLYQQGRGWQIAGFTNIARNLVTGTQLAGFLNKAAEATGAQVAGFMNRATDVKGMQLAGFLNVARNVKGVQLSGFMNVADSSDYPIGLINLVKNGEKSLGVSLDETLTSLVSFRSGGRVTYGILGLGYNFNNANKKYALEMGIGAHLLTRRNFRLNTELAVVHLADFREGEYTRVPLRILAASHLGRRLEVFAGPTFNYVITETPDGRELIKRRFWDRTSGNRMQAVYLGFTGGIQFKL